MLKRIILSGFKSFAGRTVIELNRGVVAVVGPNGSGKSNIADAIRWALGEQSKLRLRTNEREDVIFAGSDGRARASFAEVILVFDNADGRLGADQAEIELSRRLYRSGESEYRLGRQDVSFKNVQILLSEAGFGAGSYAVIGQGMIDSLLLSSPSERKLLFDEAAGIRGAELKREASMRQLSATTTNLTRLVDIKTELEPRLAQLAAVTDQAKQTRQLTRDLEQARRQYAARAARELAEDHSQLSRYVLDLRRQEHATRHALRQSIVLSTRLKLEAESWQSRLNDGARLLEAAEQKRDRYLLELASARTAAEARASRAKDLLALQAEIRHLEQQAAQLQARTLEIGQAVLENQASAERASQTVKAADEAVTAAQAKLIEIRETLSDAAVIGYVDQALRLVKQVAVSIDQGAPAPGLRLMIHKTGRLLSHATHAGAKETAERLRRAQSELEAAMQRRETASEHLTNVVILGRSLELDFRQETMGLEATSTSLEQLQARLATLTDTPGDMSETSIETAEQALKNATADVMAARRLLSEQPDHRLRVMEQTTKQEEVRRAQQATLEALKAAGERRHQLMELSWALEARNRDWGLSAEALAQQEPGTARETLAELERRLIRLEGEVTARQDLVSDSVQEYESARERYDKLSEQIADLQSAEADLHQLSKKLDGLIHERFTTNFTALSQAFDETYRLLFDGGTAGLKLSDEGDSGYGVKIMVAPPKKRATELSALSGGERAMVGVALLAAILQTRPTPFVVLDEVDAALDERNAGRLSELLGQLARRTQLIAITHNRQTMEAADLLLGVTMDGRQASSILLLELAQATDMAAR